MTHRTGAAPLVNRTTAGATAPLTKADTLALWHATLWMEAVLREWKREGFKDAQDRDQHKVQRQYLSLAK